MRHMNWFLIFLTRLNAGLNFLGRNMPSADVLERKGNEITFRLTDEDKKSWVSKRWLFKDLKFAYAQRWDPLFPFNYMKIVWYYTETPEGIKMTWIQDFEMDAKFTKFTAEQIEGFINKHSQDNMKIFKKVIEQEALAGEIKFLKILLRLE